MVLLTHGDSVATVAPGFTGCAHTIDKKVAGQISLYILVISSHLILPRILYSFLLLITYIHRYFHNNLGGTK